MDMEMLLRAVVFGVSTSGILFLVSLGIWIGFGLMRIVNMEQMIYYTFGAYNSGSSSLFSAGSVPIYQAAKISEGNVSIALFAIGASSGLLALLAITSVFSKEIHDGRRRLILKTIGASRAAVRRLVFPQALEECAAVIRHIAAHGADWGLDATPRHRR